MVSAARVMLHELASPGDNRTCDLHQVPGGLFPEVFNAQLAYRHHLSQHSGHPSVNAGVAQES